MAGFLDMYLNLAQQGSVSSQCMVALEYYSGDRVEQDFEKAMYWFLKAADQGNAVAQYNVAKMFLFGEGCEIDYRKAVYYFEKVCSNQSETDRSSTSLVTESEFYLGKCYSSKGSPLFDVEKAKVWFQKAKEAGHYDARKALEELENGGSKKNLLHTWDDYDDLDDWDDSDDYTCNSAPSQTSEDDEKVLNVFEGMNLYSKAQEQYEKKNYEEAFRLYEQASSKGDETSNYYVGYMYFMGQGVAKDYHKSFEYFTKAAENGDEKAIFFLGYQYEWGYGVEENKKQALSCFQKAAAKGHKEAENRIKGVLEDIRIAEAEEICAKAKCEFDKGNYETAVKYYLQSAEAGNAMALAGLGYCYHYGKGVKKDCKQAYEYYNKSLKKDSIAFVSYNMGLLFENGDDVEKNLETAYKYYVGAAVCGDKDGQRKADEIRQTLEEGDINKCFDKGISAQEQKNYPEAFDYFVKAAAKGHPAATCKVASCYFRGQGVVQDLQKAVEYYKKAAELDEPIAQCLLGKMYETGYPVTQDLNKALKYYEASKKNGKKEAKEGIERVKIALAEQKKQQASEQAGKIFIQACAEQKSNNNEKAFQLFKQAADMGHRVGMFCLAEFYERGIAVKKDFNQAMYYYKKSAESGSMDAQYRLGSYYEDGHESLEKDLKRAVYYYSMAARQGHYEAEEIAQALSDIDNNTTDGLERFFRSCVYLGRMANAGNCTCQYQYADYYRENGNLKEALKWYQIAGENGSFDAQMELGDIYLGQGTYHNGKLAIFWYEKAAASGERKAQFRAGCANELCCNYHMAADWYEKAAKKNHAEACLSLARYYFDHHSGLDYSRAIRLAYQWCKKAVDLGCYEARAALKIIVKKGQAMDHFGML